MDNAPQLPDRWVAFRLGHLGDVALCTGVLSHYARERGWSFDFVTQSAFADLFIGNPHVGRVFGLESGDRGFAAFLSFSRRLAAARKGWGLLDLHGNPRSRLLGLVWRGPVLRYPKMGLERRAFLASRGRCFGRALAALPVPRRYALAVERPAPPAAELRPRVYLSDRETGVARERLARLFGPGASPVALHPFATHALKAWPGERWQQLTRLLDAARRPWIALGRGAPLFPGRKEDLTNATSLRETCALLSLCRVLVTGDSGPMHLATAVDLPVVALFGPTTREWGFYPGGPCDTVLERALPCRPCSLHGKHDCPRDGECLAAIGPGEVFAAVEQAFPPDREEKD